MKRSYRRLNAALVAVGACIGAFYIGWTFPDSPMALVWGAGLVLCAAVCAVALVVLVMGKDS